MYADATSGKFLLCVTDWCFFYIEVGTYLYEHCNGVRLGLLASCDMQDTWWCWSVFCGFCFAVFHMVKACLECGKLCNISFFNIVMSWHVYIALIFFLISEIEKHAQACCQLYLVVLQYLFIIVWQCNDFLMNEIKGTDFVFINLYLVWGITVVFVSTIILRIYINPVVSLLLFCTLECCLNCMCYRF